MTGPVFIRDDRVQVVRAAGFAGRVGTVTAAALFVPNMVFVRLDGDNAGTPFFTGGARGCELVHMPKPS
jgi:hypothetical protein